LGSEQDAAHVEVHQLVIELGCNRTERRRSADSGIQEGTVNRPECTLRFGRQRVGCREISSVVPQRVAFRR
jgi:hypothetical protein